MRTIKNVFVAYLLSAGVSLACSNNPPVKNPFYDLPTFETQRLILRKLIPQDAHDLYQVFSDPQVTQFLSFDPGSTQQDIKDLVDWCLMRYSTGQPAHWAIVYKPDNKVIGWCGFFAWDPKHARAEVGTALSRKYWGKGIMKEATDTIYAYAFNEIGLNSIHAHCATFNKYSLDIFQKDGFSIIGTIPEYAYVNGMYYDRILLCLVRSAFLARIQHTQE